MNEEDQGPAPNLFSGLSRTALAQAHQVLDDLMVRCDRPRDAQMGLLGIEPTGKGEHWRRSEDANHFAIVVMGLDCPLFELLMKAIEKLSNDPDSGVTTKIEHLRDQKPGVDQ